MARWARERRHLPDVARISERFFGQLLNQFWQRFAGIHPLHGQKATLTNIGDEGSPRYQLVEEKGTYEENPDIEKERPSRYVLLPGETKLPPVSIDDLSLGH